MSVSPSGARSVRYASHISWQPSPSPHVRRKRFEHEGPAESGRVTSLVEYAPGANFPAHDHPEGEEILVLEGTFSDERGDFSAGTYMLNPEGFRHAPFSQPGCLLFVQLRKYAGPQRERVLIDTRTAPYVARMAGVSSLELYRSAHYPERHWLTKLEPNAQVGPIHLPKGEHIFVVSGTLEDEWGSYPRHTWLGLPPGFIHTPRSPGGCLLYIRQIDAG
ncbi:MAG TPA: cupin domain-containing protein [Polyangiaceae bacterium]|nr:cupin domain-containing protein [Polyangiaceae bacterium]